MHRQHNIVLFQSILITGDFNVQVSDIKLDTFFSIWNLKSLGKEPACFKTQTILLA